MDKEVADEMHQIVGQIQALDAAAQRARCKPGDAATGALIGAIRLLTEKAVISAWRYADEYQKSTGDKA